VSPELLSTVEMARASEAGPKPMWRTSNGAEGDEGCVVEFAEAISTTWSSFVAGRAIRGEE